MLLVTNKNKVKATTEETNIENSEEENLLDIKLDTMLSFESQIASLCRKASQKLHGYRRTSNYVGLKKRRSLIKAFMLIIAPYSG